MHTKSAALLHTPTIRPTLWFCVQFLRILINFLFDGTTCGFSQSPRLLSGFRPGRLCPPRRCLSPGRRCSAAAMAATRAVGRAHPRPRLRPHSRLQCHGGARACLLASSPRGRWPARPTLTPMAPLCSDRPGAAPASVLFRAAALPLGRARAAAAAAQATRQEKRPPRVNFRLPEAEA